MTTFLITTIRYDDCTQEYEVESDEDLDVLWEERSISSAELAQMFNIQLAQAGDDGEGGESVWMVERV